MKHNIISLLSVLFLSVGLSSCADETMEPDNNSNGKAAMNFTFSHPSASRATETSFENGDVVGLYVSEADKLLEISGNTVNNEGLTFEGSSWNSSHRLYWDAGLYNASAKEISATSDPVNLQFRHIMSKISINLIKGEDYEGDLPEKATVYIHNTVTSATIDLAAGVATRNMRGERKSVVARQNSQTSYSAILVPQRLENRVPLIEVVMNGVSFLYESKFLFKPGIHHIVNLVVDKNPEQIKIEIGGEITDWN